MAKKNNAADPYEETVIEDQESLFGYDQPIVEDAESKPASGDDASVETSGEEQKDSAPQEPTVPVEETTAEDDTDSEEDEEDVDESETKRFQYWQSKADTYKNELERLEARINSLPPEEVIGLAKQITARPELIDAVERAARGERPSNPSPSGDQVQEQIEVPERPAKPQRPVGYDHYEALNDPQSESYKYLLAKEQYEEELQDWLVKREEARDRQLQAERQQQALRQQQQAELQKTYNELKTGYGLTDAEVQDWHDTMVNRKMTLDDSVKIWRVLSGKVPEPAKSLRKEELATRREKSKQNPPPVGTGASAANKPKVDDASGPFVWGN